jgi:acyl-ACP thioesterase
MTDENQMHTKLTANSEVSAHQADYLRRLKLSSFFDIMQDGAYKNADDYGYGFYDMDDKGLVWVISRIKVIWENDAYFEDSLKFSTWAKGLERLFFKREYVLESQGKTIAKATALWLIIDEKTRRPQRPNVITDYQTKFIDESAIDEIPRKIDIIEDTEFVFTKSVRHCDIDINGHMNNERYVELALDALPKEHFERKLKTFEIEFKQECNFGDELILTRKIFDNSVYVRACNDLGECVFASIFEF